VIGEGLKESPMMVIQETVTVPKSIGTDELRKEESFRCKEEVCYPSPVARPY